MMIFSKHIVFDVSCKRRRFAGNIKAHFLGIIIIKKNIYKICLLKILHGMLNVKLENLQIT